MNLLHLPGAVKAVESGYKSKLSQAVMMAPVYTAALDRACI